MHVERGDGAAVRLSVSGSHGTRSDLVGEGGRGARDAREHGVNCARACSSNMLVDTAEWTRRLEAVWEWLEEPHSSTGRWNYRAIEAKVARRWISRCWFDEWVQAVRPITRPESRGYALTWQWVHRAHGHIDTSPAWHHTKPTAKRRALYRQFERSLNEQEQFELAYAPHKRT